MAHWNKLEWNIVDPRNHSAETVERLRRLLDGGEAGRPDPKRPDFFELESASDVFYVHVSPVTGSVTLLATWPREDAPVLPELPCLEPRASETQWVA